MNQPEFENSTTKTIAVVDDNLQLCQLLERFFITKGYQVVVYQCSSAFLAEKSVSFDAVILDLFMPDPDGITVLRTLAEQKYPGAILLMSGEDQSVLRAASELAKAQHLRRLDAINKPFALDGLHEQLLALWMQQNRPVQSTAFWSPAVSDLIQAIQNRQLQLYFQPKFKLIHNLPCGFEALLRWHHPEHGLIMPDKFIQIAEQSSDLMQVLTDEVIRLAIAQLADWRESGKVVNLSINVSMLNLVRLDFPEMLQNLLLAQHLSTSQLRLEVTETALMNEVTTSLDILLRLKMKGFCLSIDDFGTGYSSLAQLHRIPFSELKIDRSFVMTMHSCRESKAIVETCIKLGKSLGLSVVAEGVESELILQTLIEMGCDVGQGYFWSKAVSAAEAAQWL